MNNFRWKKISEEDPVNNQFIYFVLNDDGNVKTMIGRYNKTYKIVELPISFIECWRYIYSSDEIKWWKPVRIPKFEAEKSLDNFGEQQISASPEFEKYFMENWLDLLA